MWTGETNSGLCVRNHRSSFFAPVLNTTDRGGLEFKCRVVKSGLLRESMGSFIWYSCAVSCLINQLLLARKILSLVKLCIFPNNKNLPFVSISNDMFWHSLLYWRARPVAIGNQTQKRCIATVKWWLFRALCSEHFVWLLVHSILPSHDSTVQTVLV